MFGLDPVSALSYDFRRDITDAPALSETLAPGLDVGRSLSDAVAFTEGLHRVKDILDTLVLTERLYQVQVLSDTLGLLETLVASKTIQLRDTIVFNETITKKIEALRFPIDYITFSETTNFGKTLTVSLSECIALLENIYKTQTADLSDTLVLTEAIIKGLSDTFALSELLEHNAVLSKCGTLYLSDKGNADTLALEETLSIGISKRVSLSDSLILVDTVIRLL